MTGLQAPPCAAAGYGRLAGVVSDSRGVPLMGASVMILGPTAFDTVAASQTVERMITDAHGKFAVAHLLPGWYSLKVSSPTRLPVMRNGVRVEAGETVVASFVLGDVFAPIHFQVPNHAVSSWGDDWKWVLRTSSTTRPILRYRQQVQSRRADPEERSATTPHSQCMVGVLPGSAPHDPLAEDFGMANVFAYLQPISPDSDVLVASSFEPYAAGLSTTAAIVRRNQLRGQAQQAGVTFRQFNLVPGTAPNAPSQARGMVANYSETRLLAPKVTVTAGMDVSYLSAVETVFVAQPHVSLEYQLTPQSMISAGFGSARGDGSNAMAERLSMLGAFPQTTQRDGHLAMAQARHSELAFNHRFGRTARMQTAVFHDSLRNPAVLAWGNSQNFAGNALPSPAGTGFLINGRDYQSAGFRAVLAKNFSSHVELLGAYATGSALSAHSFIMKNSSAYSQGMLTPEQTQMFAGKMTADVPVTHTRFSVSYEWVPNDRVTLVDPAGQANLQVQPYLGLQIRQPLPTPAGLPVHIDAVAEFQNLLSQGYVPAGQNGRAPVVLSSGYHYVRGGFSVQF